jgi:hypothetical protein
LPRRGLSAILAASPAAFPDRPNRGALYPSSISGEVAVLKALQDSDLPVTPVNREARPRSVRASSEALSTEGRFLFFLALLPRFIEPDSASGNSHF